ncbi:S-layer homology domain-containing protein [Fusibacter ferrireducens]|uniref:S-layer homology domain-containing protein n=1 Tax=Fusibacter ferrireducens TaxID=2785058 RepID=A0ABR9ZZK0_9FIRM|nr:S-layer homology domain-containing protein [Fusibacter ferrireducens]MBF4695874.1 S-layer homology domain-containing protein [Fusibacter ferrireducens]
MVSDKMAKLKHQIVEMNDRKGVYEAHDSVENVRTGCPKIRSMAIECMRMEWKMKKKIREIGKIKMTKMTMKADLQMSEAPKKRVFYREHLILPVLSIVLFISSVIVVAPQSYADALPTDIQGHWSEPFVTSLVNQGVISGYPDGTFKPDKAISNVEFLSLTLKAMNETVEGASMGETWDMPIMKRALELGLVKTGEPMTNATSEITREQAAAILYRALQIKEGIQYDQCYTSILDQVIFDHDQIESAYRDSVYSMLQKGVFTGNDNHFDPKGVMTRGASCVVIERVLDKEKRTDPSLLTDGVRVQIELVQPVVSGDVVQLKFGNGKPVIDREKVLDELRQHTNNVFCGFLEDFYYYEDLINMKWYGAGYDTYEAKKERVDSEIAIGIKAMKTFYNFDYRDDLEAYKKDLQWVSATNNGKKNRIEELLNNIKNNQLVMESEFITDSSLFYYASDQTDRLRGRLYFAFKSPSQKAEVYQTHFEDAEGIVKLDVDQWYYIDCEILLGDFLENINNNWEHSKPNYGVNYYITDYIPVNPLN